MKPEEKEQLTDEAAKGRRAEKAYSEFVKPFIQEKLQILYDAFNEADPENADLLCNIARASLAVRALDAEIRSHITTGQMATFSLKQGEDDGNSD